MLKQLKPSKNSSAPDGFRARKPEPDKDALLTREGLRIYLAQRFHIRAEEVDKRLEVIERHEQLPHNGGTGYLKSDIRAFFDKYKRFF